MSVYTRLMGLDKPKISGHAFAGALAEFQAGNVTRRQIEQYFGIADNDPDLTSLLRTNNWDDLHNVLMLGEAGFPGYDTEAALKTVVEGKPRT